MSGQELTVSRKIADVLPRRSGELTFQSEWEKRAFGVALVLMEQGYFPFDDFRWQVVSAISAWERAHRGEEEAYRFYERWLLALEKTLIEKGILSKEEIDRKAAEGAREVASPENEMLEQQQTILVQFFQHAHHRAEGWLMDFQEELGQGKVERGLLERVAESIRQHMYVEEELLFPLAGKQLAEPIADLQEDHGRITDLIGDVRALVGQAAALPRIQTETSRLMNFLAAHSAKEDMGVSPDLVALLGPARTQVLLKEADAAAPAAGWVCLRRRAPG